MAPEPFALASAEETWRRNAWFAHFSQRGGETGLFLCGVEECEGVSGLFGGGRMASVCSPSAVETQQQIHADSNQFKHLKRSRLRRQRRAGQ